MDTVFSRKFSLRLVCSHEILLISRVVLPHCNVIHGSRGLDIIDALDWLKMRIFRHCVGDFTALRFVAPLTIFRTANLVTRATSIAIYTQYDAEHSSGASDRHSILSSLSYTTLMRLVSRCKTIKYAHHHFKCCSEVRSQELEYAASRACHDRVIFTWFFPTDVTWWSAGVGATDRLSKQRHDHLVFSWLLRRFRWTNVRPTMIRSFLKLHTHKHRKNIIRCIKARCLPTN